MTAEHIHGSLYCVTERLPRRLSREHYVVWSGGAWVYDKGGDVAPDRIAAAASAALTGRS